MKKEKKVPNPFIRKEDNASRVMFDVVIALLPVIFVSCVAYGFTPLWVVLVSVMTALATEFFFHVTILHTNRFPGDGSAIVTGILLALVVGPFTPLPVVAFGSAMAILFGKLLWGGLGRNVFNPALLGREFMVIFFPVLMESGSIFFRPDKIMIQEIHWFDQHFINQLFYQSSGAIGEYSVLLLFAGGIYLLLRRRISWQIPFAMMAAFTTALFLFRDDMIILFSLGGLFLGSIYMATDMPTSSSAPVGKLYFGAMIGLICIICLASGIFRGYLSYAILLMNLFVHPIDRVFRPVAWGRTISLPIRLGQALLLTAIILLATFGVVWLHHHNAVRFLLYLYIVWAIIRFCWNFPIRKRPDHL